MQTLFGNPSQQPAPVIPPAKEQHPRQPPVYPIRQQVDVTDFDMPFWSMVVFMIKWALASIPALFLLGLICGSLVVFFMFLMTIVQGALGVK